MRGAFIKALVRLARGDPRILLLTGDLGYMALEPFAKEFPNRFFNMGVAEQNMVGVATGLAKSGFIPFIYSIVPFAVLRPFEFIRNGPIFHRLPVRIVGVGGGFEYGANGPTHFGIEDIAMMRAQPGITVIAPADFEQTITALEATYDLPGPVYYRIGKDDRRSVPGLGGRFELGRAQTVARGRDVLIVTLGGIASEAHAAAELLVSEGVGAEVMVVSSMNPAPEKDLAEALGRFRVAMTVEAHYATGGLGSLVSEIVAGRGTRCRVVRAGVRSFPGGVSGSERYMWSLAELTAPQLAASAKAALAAAK